MPNYVLNRNYTLRTTSGVLSFVKGEPTFVPKHIERDVVAVGGEIVEGEAPAMLEPEKVIPQAPVGEDRRLFRQHDRAARRTQRLC